MNRDHLTDPDIRAYVAQTVSDQDEARIEEHYLLCEECVLRVESALNSQALTVSPRYDVIPLERVRPRGNSRGYRMLAAAAATILVLVSVGDRPRSPAHHRAGIVATNQASALPKAPEPTLVPPPQSPIAMKATGPSARKSAGIVPIQHSGPSRPIRAPRVWAPPLVAGVTSAVDDEILLEPSALLAVDTVDAAIASDERPPELPPFKDRQNRFKRILSVVIAPLKALAD